MKILQFAPCTGKNIVNWFEDDLKPKDLLMKSPLFLMEPNGF